MTKKVNYESNAIELEKNLSRINSDIPSIHAKNQHKQKYLMENKISSSAIHKIKQRNDFIAECYREFPDGIIIVCDGVVRSANRAFERIFAVNAAALSGLTLVDALRKLLFATDDISRLVANASHSRDSVELTRTAGDATQQYLTVRRFPILPVSGPTLPGVHALAFVDETLLREAQRLSEELVEKLLRADRQAALGEMAMALAHELNQPLGAIVNFAGAARRQLLGRAIRAGELEEVLMNIGAEAARAGEVVKSLRQFLRGAPQPSADANVERAIKAVLGFAEPAMREQAIQIKVDLAPNLPAVHGDQIIFQQIILNLVTNAIQAMDDVARDQRQLGISAFIEHGSRVRIDVCDTGIGLPAELGERIFEPFITTKENGSGLGLSIARTLVQRLGGSIEAAPEPVRGTRFTIRVPCRQEGEMRHA